MKNHYIYNGPVKEFDIIVNSKWTGETMAVSEKKSKKQSCISI